MQVKILKANAQERAMIDRLANDCDVAIDKKKMHVRRTSSRVCLSVEHGDYNGTDLLGAAIGSRSDDGKLNGFIWMAYSRNGSDRFRIKSLNYPDLIADFTFSTIPEPRSITKEHDWRKFPYAALYVLKKHLFEIKKGMNCVLVGKIPEGGLSRSASLSINLLCSILEINGYDDIDPMKISDMAQEMENEYVHSPCGKLDQVMIVFGKAGFLTLYSQKEGKVSYIPNPKNLYEVELVILDTGTKRYGLSGTDYVIRKKECEEIVDIYGKEFGFNDLNEITPKIYECLVEEIGFFNLKSRSKYIYEAKSRLPFMVSFWKSGNFVKVGELMNLDGNGLRDDYEISGYELEIMLALARCDKNILGARLSGGGRVGACIALRKKTSLEMLKNIVENGYKKSFPDLRPNIYSCDFVDGIVKLKN